MSSFLIPLKPSSEPREPRNDLPASGAVIDSTAGLAEQSLAGQVVDDEMLVSRGVDIIASILRGGTRVSDIQVRTDRHIRVHTDHGMEVLEPLGRMSAAMVSGIVLALYRSKSGARNPSQESHVEAEKAFLERLGQNGSEDFSCEGGDVLYSVLPAGRMRCQAFFDSTGIALTARVLSDKAVNIDELSFDTDIMAKIKELVTQRSGIGFITGQTGAGKSTTLAGLIGYLQTLGKHIVTVEQPIEYRFADRPPSLVTQQEIGTHVDSFPQGLVDALRKRPHVIMIGEIRDRETMETAMEAAQTGHFVLSTLHTRSAPETIARIIGLFSPERVPGVLMQLGESLRFVLSQGLLPAANGEGSVLCYEVLLNNSITSRSAIQKYQDNHKNLESHLRTPGNRSWEVTVEELVNRGKITREVAKENTLRTNENDS